MPCYAMILSMPCPRLSAEDYLECPTMASKGKLCKFKFRIFDGLGFLTRILMVLTICVGASMSSNLIPLEQHILQGVFAMFCCILMEHGNLVYGFATPKDECATME